MRAALVPPPAYTDIERDLFYEILARLAALVAAQELTVIVPATANRRRFRECARPLVPRFIEVWLDVSVAEGGTDARGVERSLGLLEN